MFEVRYGVQHVSKLSCALGAHIHTEHLGALTRTNYSTLLMQLIQYVPLLSSWDRSQENSALVGRKAPGQACIVRPDLYWFSSEQAKRTCPKMTEKGCAQT